MPHGAFGKAGMDTVRVLVIDDDPFVLRMLSRMLSDFNCAIATASSGTEGIDRYRQSPADLVVTDVAIPISEGLETIRTLRGLEPALPILAISGGGWLVAGAELLDLASRAGATEVLAKPFSVEQLRDAVSYCLLAAKAPDRTSV
jgi:two-component system, chemotaxis family, chemotaxis protein CheY